MGRRFDPDRAHVKNGESLSKSFKLIVVLTHFVPPKPTKISIIWDFIRPRLSSQYLRSIIRLVVYGKRGYLPWKKDVMTEIRRNVQADRRDHLLQVLQSVLKLEVKEVEVYIHTNSMSEADYLKLLIKDSRIHYYVFSQYSKMNYFHNSPWVEDNPRSPWLLTWEHKKTLTNLSAQEDDSSLFLYLENDSLFTQENLDYWLEALPILSRQGFIPSFLRVELDESTGEWFPIDNLQTQPYPVETVNVRDGDREFIQLPNTYAGCYLLNLQLLKEYLASDSFDLIKSKTRIWWDIGARTTAGLQFENIPEGATSRYLVPRDVNGIARESWVHHLPNIYIKQIGTKDKLPAHDFLMSELSEIDDKSSNES